MSHLPPWIDAKIEQLLTDQDLIDLQSAYTALSQRYRQEAMASGYHSAQETMAYVAARLPATYAVVQRCLNEIPKDYYPSSILDLGAGSGSATLACAEKYPESTMTLMESNQDSIQLGEKIFDAYPKAPLKTTYRKQDIMKLDYEDKGHLIIASYVFGELTPLEQKNLFVHAFNLCHDYFLIILPGTPVGFDIIHRLREQALDSNATIIAPCSHQLTCPIYTKNTSISPNQPQDWCHFSVRLRRSSWHRHLKFANLSYEDEKFSYLLISKHPPQNQPMGRLIKNPQHRGGHGVLDICTDGKLISLPYSRKKSPTYQTLKRLAWGDSWDGGNMLL